MRSSVGHHRFLGLSAHRSVHRHRPVQPDRRRATRRAAAGSSSAGRRISAEETPCARQVLSTVARRAYRGDVDRCRPAGAAGLLPARPRGDRHVRRRHRAGAAPRSWPARSSSSASSAIPRTCRPAASIALSDLELASRLSFFLWSSIPDDELLRVASQGTLKTPAVLEQQVRRMLADPKSRALVDNFVGQWLHLRNLKNKSPELARVPRFRRQPAPGAADRDRAVLRARSFARTATCSI